MKSNHIVSNIAFSSRSCTLQASKATRVHGVLERASTKALESLVEIMHSWLIDYVWKNNI